MVVYVREITEVYVDLPLLRKKDVYLIQAFVDSKDKSSDLKCLNFVQNIIQAIFLGDIATVDRHRISHQTFAAQTGNGPLYKLDWPHCLITLPHSFLP